MESQPLTEPLAEKAKSGSTRSRQLLRVLLYLELLFVLIGYYLDRNARMATTEVYDFYNSEVHDGEEYGRMIRDQVRERLLQKKGIRLEADDRENVDRYSNLGIFNLYQMEIKYTPRAAVLAAGCVGMGAASLQAGTASAVLPSAAAAAPNGNDLVVRSVKVLSTLRFQRPFWEEFSWLEIAGMALQIVIIGTLFCLALVSINTRLLIGYRQIYPSLIGPTLSPFWIAGLAASQIYFLSWTLPLEGEAYEWAQYILLGTVFPLLILLLQFSRRVQSLLILAFFVIAPISLGWRHWPLCCLLGTGQCLLLLGMLRFRARRTGVDVPFSVQWRQLAVGTVLMTLGWQVAKRFMWWTDFPGFLISSGLTVTISLVSIILVTATFARLCDPRRISCNRIVSLSSIPAFVVFAILAASVYGMSDSYMLFQALHHWAVVVEPADLVRQGGWLLWDVPSQYGFLNSLLIAWLPFSSVWQSFYVLNAFLLFITACIVFRLLQSLRPGVVHYLFSLVTTVVSVFLIGGFADGFTGPFAYPNIGPYRFFWCFAILGILSWDYESLVGKAQIQGKTFWVGNLAWLSGTLWSPESAVYCTTIWLPVNVLLALRRSLLISPGRALSRDLMRGLAFWFILPLMMLALALVLICGVYLIELGHLPDGHCFIDYCLAAPKTLAQPMIPNGAVTVLLLAYILVATTGAYCLRDNTPLKHFPLVVGAAAALWAVGSYFVSNSIEAVVTSLSPLFVAAFAAVLRVLDGVGKFDIWAAWVKISSIPVFTVLLAMTFCHPLFEQRISSTAVGLCLDFTQLLPEVDPVLQQVLSEAGVEADTPIFFANNFWPRPCWHGKGHPEPLTGTQAWLPGGASHIIYPLLPERRHIYFARFVERTRLSGYVIIDLEQWNMSNAELEWLFGEISKTHKAGRTFRKQNWLMIWFECREKR